MAAKAGIVQGVSNPLGWGWSATEGLATCNASLILSQLLLGKDLISSHISAFCLGGQYCFWPGFSVAAVIVVLNICCQKGHGLKGTFMLRFV